MSDPVSALNGASYSGLAEITESGLGGMITLRGDFTAPAFAEAVSAVTGAALPEVRQITSGESGAVAWMSPDELLLLVEYDAAESVVARLSEALAGTHAMAVNVSDARACFTVSGDFAREVLGKLCPVDLSPAAFGAGDFRRTRFAQVAAAFWLDEGEVFHIVCFRSVADYMFNLLRVAAHPQAPVGVY